MLGSPPVGYYNVLLYCPVRPVARCGAWGVGGVPRSASCALQGPMVSGSNGQLLLTRRASLSFRPGVNSVVPPLVPLMGFFESFVWSPRSCPVVAVGLMALSFSLMWSFLRPMASRRGRLCNSVAIVLFSLGYSQGVSPHLLGG